MKVRQKFNRDDRRWDFLPKGTKAELDQFDEQKNELEKQANKMKKSQKSLTNDSDDSLSDSADSSSDGGDEEEEEENAVGGSDEPSENTLKPSGKWYYCSDSHVREVTEESVLKTQAYILFYERIF